MFAQVITQKNRNRPKRQHIPNTPRPTRSVNQNDLRRKKEDLNDVHIKEEILKKQLEEKEKELEQARLKNLQHEQELMNTLSEQIDLVNELENDNQVLASDNQRLKRSLTLDSVIEHQPEVYINLKDLESIKEIKELDLQKKQGTVEDIQTQVQPNRIVRRSQSSVQQKNSRHPVVKRHPSMTSIQSMKKQPRPQGLMAPPLKPQAQIPAIKVKSRSEIAYEKFLERRKHQVRR